MALTVSVSLVLTSAAFTAFADDGREAIVVYPGFKSGGRTSASGDGTPSGGGNFMFANLTDTAGSSGFPQTDSRIARSTGTEQTSTSNTTGYTYLTPGSIEKHVGFIYKPCVSDDTNTSGWYDVYAERLLYYDSSASYAVPDAVHVDVIHEGGIAHYLMDMTPNDSYTDKTKYADLVKIGTFLFSDVSSHQVRLFSPVDKSTGSDKVRFDFGGVMFVPADEPTEKKYYRPVYSDDLSDGITASWYEAVGKTTFSASSATANIPAGSALKINYAEGEDASEAVEFTEGAINFKLWWRNTEKNDAYFSVILGKSKDQNAEFRIYSEKVEYAENGVVKCEIPVHGYYAYYYNTVSNEKNRYTLSGYYDEENSVSYYPHMMRIEISDPEALSDSGSKITDNLKTVKVIANYGSANALIMALGSLPADSVLNNTEYDDPSDNYIEFKNTAGANESKAVDINNISIMIPDSDIVSEEMYAESINTLKYSKSGNELAIYEGTAGAEAEVTRPAEITNTLLKSSGNSGVAVMAPYSASGKLSSAPTVRYLSMLPGTKKKVAMTVDTDPDEMSKVRFFIWDSLSHMVPAKEAESSSIY